MFTNINEESDIDRMFMFIKKSFAPWKEIQNKDQLDFKRIGGVSNYVYKIEILKGNEDIKPKSIICKLFGESSSNIINRDEENNRTLYLSKLDICPRVYSYNQYMRLEEYIPNKVFTYEYMISDTLSLKVMQKLAKLHTSIFDGRLLAEQKSKIKTFMNKDNSLIIKAFKFKENLDTCILSIDQFKKLSEIVEYFNGEELLMLSNILEELHYKDLKLCHNDLFKNNMLLINSDQSNNDIDVYLIDYEYSDYNYIAYDIANYFQQYVFNYLMEYPYCLLLPHNFPTSEKLELYIDEYIKYTSLYNEHHYHEHLGCNKDKLVQTKLDRTMLIHDISICLLHCNFFWMIWSILMNGNPCLSNFDFIDFAYMRFKLYLIAKDKLTKKGQE